MKIIASLLALVLLLAGMACAQTAPRKQAAVSRAPKGESIGHTFIKKSKPYDSVLNRMPVKHKSN